MLLVLENEISLRNSSDGPGYFAPLRPPLTITKNASLAEIARYISITTISTVGYLQIFNAGHFFSSKHCNDLQRKKHWDCHGFRRNHKVWLYFTWQAGPQPADIFNWTNSWTCFWQFFGGIARLLSPLLRDQQQDLSASLRNRCCKRLGSHPKRSIKPSLPLVFFSQWTLIIHKPDN